MMMPRLLYAHMIKNEESDRLSKVPPADCDISRRSIQQFWVPS